MIKISLSALHVTTLTAISEPTVLVLSKGLQIILKIMYLLQITH